MRTITLILNIRYMKRFLTFALLLIGLVGYTQTNTHQQIYGTVFTQPDCRLTSPYNEINVQVFEYDTVRNVVSASIAAGNYTLGWSINGATGFYNYMIMFMNPPTKPVIVRMTPNRGTCAFIKYQPTFAPWSLNTRGAAKIIVPYTALGTMSVQYQNVHLIPYVLRNPNTLSDQ